MPSLPARHTSLSAAFCGALSFLPSAHIWRLRSWAVTLCLHLEHGWIFYHARRRRAHTRAPHSYPFSFICGPHQRSARTPLCLRRVRCRPRACYRALRDPSVRHTVHCLTYLHLHTRTTGRHFKHLPTPARSFGGPPPRTLWRAVRTCVYTSYGTLFTWHRCAFAFPLFRGG